MTATNNQPAEYPPGYLLPTPKTRANGRTASDDNVLTPDATPDRIADGPTASGPGRAAAAPRAGE